MGAEAVTFEEAKRLTLEYWYAERNKLPLPMRDMPRRIIAAQSLSINAIIANIESNTEIGEWLVAEYVDSMGMVVSG